jgi:hypothetical protein
VKCGVFFAVRTEFLNTVKTSFGLKRDCIFFAYICIAVMIDDDDDGEIYAVRIWLN